jgi:hypothetical protein
MNKILLLLYLVCIPFQVAFSQPSLVKVNIAPDSSVTSGNMVFHCTITNPTKRNYGYFVFDPNCENHLYPNFWKISIKKDSTSFVDCSMGFVLRNRINDPYIKLYKHSTKTFDFCINFDKLYPGEELGDLLRKLKSFKDQEKLIKDYTNKSYGTYEVRVIYLKDPFDPTNPLSLLSNWASVQYVHK